MNRLLTVFLWSGVSYGVLLGGVIGTFIEPGDGTFEGAYRGLLVGIVIAMLAVFSISFYNRRAIQNGVTYDVYQRTVTRFTAGLAIIIAAIPATIFAPIAGLAAAYVVHRYAEIHMQEALKHKGYATSLSINVDTEGLSVVFTLAEMMLRRSKWPLICSQAIVAIIVFTIGMDIPTYGIDIPTYVIGYKVFAAGIAVISAVLLIAVGVALLAVFICLANGLSIPMLNRVLIPQTWSLEQYQRFVGVIFAATAILTIHPATFAVSLPVAIIVGLTAALIAGLAAQDYAAWYYESRENVDNDRHDWLMAQHRTMNRK